MLATQIKKVRIKLILMEKIIKVTSLVNHSISHPAYYLEWNNLEELENYYNN
ncbi:hypothetical protein D3C76_1671910 [compost metagenome]